MPAAEPEVTFEVERFAAAGDRLEIAGRWFGVRGRRFLRPTLELEVAGERHRMLARLDDKPWTASDGEEWRAAFDWDEQSGPVASAELAVGSDLTVLVAPPSGGSKPKRPSAAERELTSSRAELDRIGAELADVRAARAADRDASDERLRAAQAANRAVLEQLDEAHRDAERVKGELRHALAALEEMRGERDAALSARDTAEADARRLDAERRDAVDAGAAAAMEVLDGTADRWDRLQADLDAAHATARTAAKERDAAVRERDEARRRLDAARRERVQPRPEPAPPERNAESAPAEEPPRPVAKADWRARAAGVAAVGIPLLILALLVVMFGF